MVAFGKSAYSRTVSRLVASSGSRLNDQVQCLILQFERVFRATPSNFSGNAGLDNWISARRKYRRFRRRNISGNGNT